MYNNYYMYYYMYNSYLSLCQNITFIGCGGKRRNNTELHS